MTLESPIISQEGSNFSNIPQAMDGFFASQRYQDLRKNTRNSYRSDLTLFMQAFEQAELTRLDQITPESISTFCGQSKATTTAARRLAAIKVFFNWATAEGKVAQNPAENLKISVEAGRKPLNYLTATEINKLIEKASSLRDKALIIIAFKTGANISEIASLTSENIFLARDQIVIRIPRSNNTSLYLLDEDSSKIISAFASSHSESGPLFTKERDFDAPTNIPLTRQGLWLRIKKYAKAIGKPDISPRTLRNTFVMNFRSDNPYELANHLGIHPKTATEFLAKRKISR